MILLKNALCLSMSARQSKNEVLTGTMLNVINPSSMFKLTDLIDAVLLISNIKFVDPAVFVLNGRKVSNCCNALS